MNSGYTHLLQEILQWSTATGIKVLVILIGATIIWKLSSVVITNVIRKTIKSRRYLSKEAEQKREDTLIHVFNRTFLIIFIIVVFTMLLDQLGIATGSLIAIGSVAGVALGFGGQYIIKDVLTGFFIILENQYRIGDVVCVGTTCGVVEDLNLRDTVLRDQDGTVHHISNGEIKIASNLSKDHANINIDITVPYETDIKKAIYVINTIGNRMAKEKEWKEKIFKPAQFVRIDDFGSSGIILKIVGETQPLVQWAAMGELRMRLMQTFRKNHITFSLPQIVVRQDK